MSQAVFDHFDQDGGGKISTNELIMSGLVEPCLQDCGHVSGTVRMINVGLVLLSWLLHALGTNISS